MIRVDKEIYVRSGYVDFIDSEGKRIGIIPFYDALKRCEDEGLNLVELDGKPKNPVCRAMDYGKYKFLQSKKNKENVKKNKTPELKEIQLKPNIAKGDLDLKTSAIKEFLTNGHKVKVVMRFRGRETAHSKMHQEKLMFMVDSLKEVGTLEKMPDLLGRDLIIYLNPLNK